MPNVMENVIVKLKYSPVDDIIAFLNREHTVEEEITTQGRVP